MGNSFMEGFTQRMGELYVNLPDVPLPSAGQWGILLVAVGLGMMGPWLEKDFWPSVKAWWGARKFAKSERLRKQKRTKEAMDNREARLNELMCELIVDGLLQLDVEGKISGQEHRKKLKEFGLKMGLNDLIATKSRKDEIKDSIIKRIVSEVHAKTFKTVDKCGRRMVTTAIPGPKPGEKPAA